MKKNVTPNDGTTTLIHERKQRERGHEWKDENLQGTHWRGGDWLSENIVYSDHCPVSGETKLKIRTY
jgi:hypothetical protein